MIRTRNYKEKIIKRYYQIIVLTIAVILIVACAPAPTPTTLPTITPPTPFVTVSAPTHPTPTVERSANSTILSPVTLPSTEEVETKANQNNSNMTETNSMNIKIGDYVLTATLADNSSVDALKEALTKGPITINMRDYGGMEKVGSLGMDLPRNDEQITTEAGDIILFQGSAFVIYYAPNSWNFTRIGKINNVSAEELRKILGDGNVTITISLP